jgi:hypothetical protein
VSRLDYDTYLYLMGDEDGDVGLQCRECDRGGLPVVFYTTNKKVTGYQDASVIVVHSILDLVMEGTNHLWKVHNK